MHFISKYTSNFIGISFVLLNLLLVSYAFARDHNFLSSSENSLYRLAISKRELHHYDEPSVSPDGQWIAYTVKERVDNPKEFQYFLLDGMPSFMTGCYIYLSSQDGNQVCQVTPKNGYSWRPVWSPNGEKLAFYSNASGKCSLWIYDLSSDLSKELSNLPINTAIYADDKPIWNPEGTEIYVPLALSNQLNAKISFFDFLSLNQNEMIVKTFNTNETQSDHLYSEQKSLSWLISSLAAIDVNTGSVRIIISDQTSPAPSYMKLSSTGRWLSYRSIPQLMDNPSKSSFDLVISTIKGDHQGIIIDENLTSNNGKDYIWHPTKDILVYEKDKKIHLVELDDKGVARKTILFNESSVEFIKKPLLFTQDGNFLLAGGKPYHESYQDKPASLFLLPLNENCAPIEIQIKSPWKYLSTISIGESEAWQSKKNEISVVLEKENTGETAIAKLDTTEAISIDQKYFVWKGAARLRPYPAKRNLNINYWIYEDLITPKNIYCTGIDFASFNPGCFH